MSPADPAAALDDVRHSVLLTTVHSLADTPNFLASAVSTAARHSTETLRIVVLSPLFDPPADDAAAPLAPGGGISRTAHFEAVQRLLTFVYVQATKVAQDVDRILLDVSVLQHACVRLDIRRPHNLLPVVWRVPPESPLWIGLRSRS